MVYLEANQDNVARAKSFLLSKWKERASELGRPEPTDLSTACKFASYFAQVIFGGRIRGNKDHQYLELRDGRNLDLTDNGNFQLKHDPHFFGNPEHRESMESIKPRVDSWVKEFMGSKTANEIHFSIGEYLKPNSHKVAISVPELVAQTNSFSTKNRPGCVAKLIDSKPSDLFLEYNVKCDLKTSDPAGHTVRIRFDLSKVKDEATAKDLDVKVSCTCPAELWWGSQYNLHSRDALEGEPRPLLAPPTERLDLRGRFVICKHLAVCLDRVLPSVQNNINTILRKRRVEEAEPIDTPERLKKRQLDMKKRQELKKLRDRRNKVVERQLLDGLRKREEESSNVIQRDTPATPEEKAKLPVLLPDPAVETPPKPPVKEPDPVPEPAPIKENPKKVERPSPPKKPAPDEVIKRSPVPATTPAEDRKNKEKLLERETKKKLPDQETSKETDEVGDEPPAKGKQTGIDRLMERALSKSRGRGKNTDRDAV